MEIKHFALEDMEVKEAGDARTVEGYASVFNNVDSYNDIVMPGAFAKSLGKRVPVMLWQHNSTQPIGVWDDFMEQEKGLFIKGTILPTQLGNDAYTLAKAKAVKGMSIGYSPVKWERDDKKGIRRLTEVELWEVSLVTFPANDKAQVTRVKSRPQTVREFEDFLRDAGFSRADATAVALHGYKALNQGEPDDTTPEEKELRDVLALLNTFNNPIHTQR